jgi:hypothetical protein
VAEHAGLTAVAGSVGVRSAVPQSTTGCRQPLSTPVTVEAPRRVGAGFRRVERLGAVTVIHGDERSVFASKHERAAQRAEQHRRKARGRRPSPPSRQYTGRDVDPHGEIGSAFARCVRSRHRKRGADPRKAACAAYAQRDPNFADAEQVGVSGWRPRRTMDHR